MPAPNLQKLIESYVRRFQEIEDAFFDIHEAKDLDQAKGVQLDGLGDKVGRPRLGMGDTEYRTYIKAQVLANRSKGTVEDVLAVFKAVLGPTFLITMTEGTIAEFEIAVTPALTATQGRVLDILLDRARAAAVKSNFTYLVSAGPYFGFASDAGALGFGAGDLVASR